MYYCHRQNIPNLGKINLIYCQLKSSRIVRSINKIKTPFSPTLSKAQLHSLIPKFSPSTQDAGALGGQHTALPLCSSFLTVFSCSNTDHFQGALLHQNKPAPAWAPLHGPGPVRSLLLHRLLTTSATAPAASLSSVLPELLLTLASTILTAWSVFCRHLNKHFLRHRRCGRGAQLCPQLEPAGSAVGQPWPFLTEPAPQPPATNTSPHTPSTDQ